MPREELSEEDYLRQVELLARDVVGAADTVSYEADPDDATPLQRAINALAREIRYWHFEGDGCFDERPLQQLGGVLLIEPGEGYATACAAFGVEERPQGWALWYTWDDKDRACTMVTTAVETTRGLLENWSHGRDVMPGQLDRAQIAAVCRTWRGPLIHSPRHAKQIGLAGH